MRRNRRLYRILCRWEREARELYVEHKGEAPIHYWLHQTKHHYKKVPSIAGTDFERAYLFRQRDELLSLISTHYPAHLYRDIDCNFEYEWVVCVHLSGSNLITFHISRDSLWRFDHLPCSPSDWDGTGNRVRSQRIADEVRRQAEGLTA